MSLEPVSNTYRVIFNDTGHAPVFAEGAYWVVSDGDSHVPWLLVKDHEHKTTFGAPSGVVLCVETYKDYSAA